MAGVIVLDASVVIAHLQRSDVLHGRATRLLAQHARERFAMAAVTKAEVLVRPAELGVLGEAERSLAALRVDVLDLLGGSAAALALLRASTRLRLPDCCVLEAAERTGAGLATFDERLAGAAGSRGVRVIG